MSGLDLIKQAWSEDYTRKGIPSFLYSFENLRNEFSDFFEALEIKEEASVSRIYGKEYPRRVLNAIFKKVM